MGLESMAPRLAEPKSTRHPHVYITVSLLIPFVGMIFCPAKVMASSAAVLLANIMHVAHNAVVL